MEELEEEVGTTITTCFRGSKLSVAPPARSLHSHLDHDAAMREVSESKSAQSRRCQV